MANSSHCAPHLLRSGSLSAVGKVGRAAEQGAAASNQHFINQCSFHRLWRSGVLFFFPISSHCASQAQVFLLPPPKRLTVCPPYLSAKTAHFKHSPVPTDFRRAVLFLSPSCRHWQLRTD